MVNYQQLEACYGNENYQYEKPPEQKGHEMWYGGVSFGEKINLSNTTDTDSTRAEIDSDADSVVVTWCETTQTSDTPVMKVSSDNGATFGPLLTFATNETIGEGGELPEEAE